MPQRKRGLSAFDILCLEHELQVLVDGHFNKAYQPTRDEVLLSFRASGEGRIDVAIGLGDYITLTEKDREMPQEPPQFSKQLRKHLSGGKVLGVRQHDFDRVMVFEIGKHDGVYELVVECFHTGNVVLVQDDEIVQPLIHTEWSSRVIRPGRDWHFPPMAFNPRAATEPQFLEAMRESDTDIIRTLASVLNLGPLYAEEVCLRAGVDKQLSIQEATPGQLATVANTVIELIRQVETEPQPVLYRDEDGQPIDAAPVPLKTRAELEAEPVDHLWQAFDILFAPEVSLEGETTDPRLEKLEQMRGRLQRQVDDIAERIRGFMAEEARERQAGDLLYAHFADVDELLKTCQERHQDGGWGALFEDTPEADRVKVVELKPQTGTIVLGLPDTEGRLHEVEVSIKKSLGANAEVHYERGKEMREKEEGARKALAKARRELEELEERGTALIDEIEAERAAPDPTHKFWFDKFRWFITTTGNLVVAGRDAGTNDKVVKKHLEDNDRYVHANLTGAPSVVVKATDEGIPEAALEEAGQFAVAYSKAWSQQIGEAQAYWVTPPQVSKTPESGEYVPRGSFIIRGERTYVRGATRCGIGETHVEGQRKVMGGPPLAIKARCDRYVVFEPGRLETGDVASLLSEVFEVPVEEVQACLPPGPVDIIESVGIDESKLEELS